jgi:hypothetical protein
LDLEKVEKHFKEHGKFIFRASRFHLDNIPTGSNDPASTLNFSFQNAFLNMLKNSATDEQVERFQSEFVPRQIAERIGKGMRLCEVAEQYFDSLLYKGACGDIPSEIRQHILDCRKCSEKFFKYSIGSLTPLTESQQFYTKNIIKQLVRHFSLLSEKVCCTDIKSFLPVMLDKRLRIKVPTPVTVHIDSCNQCHKDLSNLSRLDLEPDQLTKLSNFYARPSKADSVQCKDAWGYIDLAAEFQFDHIPVKILEHLCLCKDCRELLYDKRRIIAEQALESDRVEGYPCQMVNPSDLFDMAFPFGLDSLDTENHIYCGPFIGHIKNCHRCLERLADISRILFSIDEHKDSGILTCYELEEQKPNLDLSYGRDIFDEEEFADFANWPQGARISCEQVKRFLPELSNIESKTKVPAAAIAHIEQCARCKEDLQTIRLWKLDYKRIARLSEFLAQQTFTQSNDCVHIQQNKAKIIESLAAMQFEQLDTETLNHICLCRTCRDMIYKARQKMPVHTNHAAEKDELICDNIKPADLFDYVLPYGLDPAEDEYAKFRQPLVRHLRSCPKCLEKIRQLYNNIYAIAERSRLKVPPGFEPDKKAVIGHWHAAQARRIAENIDELDDEQFATLLSHLSMAGEDPYKGWGVKVQIIRKAQGKFSQAEQEITAEAIDKDACDIALEYMYDVIYSKDKELVPAQVQAHIESCSYCSKQLAGIKVFLTEHAGFRSQSKAVARARIGAYAKEHLEFIGKQVDCRLIKEFLPLLADPMLSITIPTPITVHLDQCSQCSKDVAMLRSLNLKSSQLDMIAGFYAEAALAKSPKDEPFGNCIVHEHADNITELFALMQFKELSPKLIRRICLCRDCHDKVYEKRKAFIMEIDDTRHDENCCDNTTDLLVYCLPRYFDITDDWYKKINESVTEHLRHCKTCFQKLQLLHRAIFNIADRENSGVVTCYKLAPVIWDKDNPNAPIGCRTLRPYLPGFVDEPLGLMVPSSMAAHLMDCSQCMDDYTGIDSLDLHEYQLEHLGRLFAGISGDTGFHCKKAREHIENYVVFKFSEIAPEILEHLQLCPDCRREIQKRRQTMIDELSSEFVDDGFNCRFIRNLDLFDCCFPSSDSAGRIYPVLTAHLGICQRCLKRVQRLYETVCEIADRAESGILTENNIPVPEKEKEGFAPIDSQYSQWPIRVWAKSETVVKTSTGILPFTEKIKEMASVVNLRNIKKTAAAAMIPVAVGLFLYFFFSMSPSIAMARTYSDVVSSVKKIVNVCIKKYKPGQTEPVRVEWISRSSNVIVQITDRQVLLFDLRNKVRRIKDLQTGTVQSDIMTENLFLKAHNLIESALDIVPFEDLSDVPASEWNQVDNKETNAGEVYDLTWQKAIGKETTECHKRRYFFPDDRTNVPNKVEVYTKDSFEDNYTLWEYREITAYSDETDISRIIKSAFGDEMEPPVIYGQPNPGGSIPKQ